VAFAINPNLLAGIEADLAPRIERAAEKGGELLRMNVSAGARSGRRYSQLSRQSSAPGEFYQEQSGEFRDAVAANPTNDSLTYEVGVFGLDQGRLNHSEFAPGSAGGRQNLARTFEAPSTLREMLDAMEE
jgi:hypothetical protein